MPSRFDASRLLRTQKRASWDELLARCVRWQPSVSRPVSLGPTCEP